MYLCGISCSVLFLNVLLVILCEYYVVIYFIKHQYMYIMTLYKSNTPLASLNLLRE